MGILIGAWGVVGSLFFTFAFTFREDAWQIFGGTMLIIITMLGEFIGFIESQCWIDDVDGTISDKIRNHFKMFIQFDFSGQIMKFYIFAALNILACVVWLYGAVYVSS